MKPPTRLLVLPAILMALILSGCTGSEPEPAPSQSSLMATDTLDYAMTSFMNEDAVAVLAEVRWPGGEWSNRTEYVTWTAKNPPGPTTGFL